MKVGALYKINTNLSILFILILIGSVLAAVSLVQLSAHAQNKSSSVNISNLNSSGMAFNNITKYAQVIKYYDKELI
jgi:hypothetical protein